MDLLPPIFAGWLLIQGLAGAGPLPIVLALIGGGFLAFTRHRRYDLFEDALVIRHFGPRTRVVYLSEIEDVQIRTQAMVGTALIIDRNAGGRLIIKPSDSEAFLSRLTAALPK